MPGVRCRHFLVRMQVAGRSGSFENTSVFRSATAHLFTAKASFWRGQAAASIAFDPAGAACVCVDAGAFRDTGQRFHTSVWIVERGCPALIGDADVGPVRAQVFKRTRPFSAGREREKGEEDDRRPHASIATGFSRFSLIADSNSAPRAPSISRWSTLRVTDMTVATVSSPSSPTTGFFAPAPTARIAP